MPDGIAQLRAGRNHSAMRDHNERLILTTINREGALPGSEIARRTGLSAQTVSNILRQLKSNSFVRREEPLRGSVGKPSIPMGLNPEGALSLGLKIGRRSVEIVLVDLSGRVIGRKIASHRYPVPDKVLAFVSAALTELTAPIPESVKAKIAGIGVAMPYQIWNWHETIDAPRSDLLAWKGDRFRDDLEKSTGLPVHIENDATAAARAEHVFGKGAAFRDYAYLYLASFIGGGLVLDNAVFPGRMGNAGAFGSLPMTDGHGRQRQLIDLCSIHLLEHSAAAAGIDPEALCADPLDWSGLEEIVSGWIDEISPALARSVVTIAAVIDIQAVLIDGAFPAEVRSRLVDSVSAALLSADHRGIIVPAILSGSIGAGARALGAASMPLLSLYLLGDQEQSTARRK